MPAIEAAEASKHDASSHPGAIKINVQGAFIVDQDPSPSPTIEAVDGVQHDTKDIRLPNHKLAVSHVAVDVGFPFDTRYD